MKVDAMTLTALLKTVYGGKVRLRKALHEAAQPQLRSVLQGQLLELRAIEAEAYAIATQRGWELAEMQPARRGWALAAARLKFHDQDDREIAALMIRSNTRSMIAGAKMLRGCKKRDERVSALAQRLVDCEYAAIERLLYFL